MLYFDLPTVCPVRVYGVTLPTVLRNLHSCTCALPHRATTDEGYLRTQRYRHVATRAGSVPSPILLKRKHPHGAYCAMLPIVESGLWWPLYRRGDGRCSKRTNPSQLRSFGTRELCKLLLILLASDSITFPWPKHLACVRSGPPWCLISSKASTGSTTVCSFPRGYLWVLVLVPQTAEICLSRSSNMERCFLETGKRLTKHRRKAPTGRQRAWRPEQASCVQRVCPAYRVPPRKIICNRPRRQSDNSVFSQQLALGEFQHHFLPSQGPA